MCKARFIELIDSPATHTTTIEPVRGESPPDGVIVAPVRGEIQTGDEGASSPGASSSNIGMTAASSTAKDGGVQPLLTATHDIPIAGDGGFQPLSNRKEKRIGRQVMFDMSDYVRQAV